MGSAIKFLGVILILLSLGNSDSPDVYPILIGLIAFLFGCYLDYVKGSIDDDM